MNKTPMRLSVLVVAVVGLALSTSPAMAAKWSVIPKGKWGCSSGGNRCLAATGFRPNARQRQAGGWRDRVVG